VVISNGKEVTSMAYEKPILIDLEAATGPFYSCCTGGSAL
jgi:hypothetical protein